MIYNPNKYVYVPISRETIDGARKYATPDGERLPSVTTILDATKPREAMESLMRWKRRVGEKKAIEISTEASGRGTRMHKWLENYIKNGEMGESGSNPFSQQSHRMAQHIIDNGLQHCDELWGTEVALYFPRIYAGTTDLVGMHRGMPCIMDFKQTNKPKKREWISDYFLQLAAYATAHNEVHGTNINRGVVFMCSADEQYQEFVLEGTEFATTVDTWWRRVEQYYLKNA